MGDFHPLNANHTEHTRRKRLPHLAETHCIFNVGQALSPANSAKKDRVFNGALPRSCGSNDIHTLPCGRGSVSTLKMWTLIPNRDRKGAGAFGYFNPSAKNNWTNTRSNE